MAGDTHAGITGRLVTLVTATMPPSRRHWGRAMSAELAYTRSRSERARLAFGAARVALLPPPGAADYRRAASRSAALAAIAYVPLGVGLYLANAVFPSPQDSTAGDLAMDAYLLVALMAAGALARRASARPGAPVIAGIAAGLVLAVLGLATLAAIDNSFLSIVSHQQGKIDGFRASGMTSMRAYINGYIEATAPGVAIVLAIAGAIFGAIGAAVAQEATSTWSHLRRHPRR